MATLELNNKNRATRNNCPFESNAETQIRLNGFAIGSTRKHDTIYRQLNIRSPEKNAVTKNIISLENISSLLPFSFSLEKPFNPFFTLLIT